MIWTRSSYGSLFPLSTVYLIRNLNDEYQPINAHTVDTQDGSGNQVDLNRKPRQKTVVQNRYRMMRPGATDFSYNCRRVGPVRSWRQSPMSLGDMT